MPTDRPVRNRLFTLAFGLACLIGPACVYAQGGAGSDQQGTRQRNGGGQGAQPADRGGGGGGRGFGGGGFGRMMGGGDPMSPSVDSRELESIGKTLALTPDQKDLAKGLFDSYQEQFKAKASEIRDKMDKMREDARNSDNPREAFQSMAPLMTDWRDQRQKFEDQFFSDYKAILTPDQQAKWPTIERDRRRDKTMDRGRLSGERMDIIKLVQDAKLAPDTMGKVQPLLDQYATDLDRELVNRNKVYDEVAQKMMTQFRGGDAAGNQDDMQKMIERGRDASVKVRDLNRRYARQVEAQLPDEQKPAWQKAVKEASFPDVYRTTTASRQITAAQGFSDLDTTQKDGIAALKETYTRDLQSANEKLASAQEQMEMSITAAQIFQRFGGNNQDDPTSEPRQQKRDLDQKTIESLKKILNPDQIDRLPTTNRGDGAPGGNGGNTRTRTRPGGNGSQNDTTPRRPDREG